MTSHEMNYKIFKYAVEGKKYKIRDILKKGTINVDVTDIGGNTSLYYACLNKRRGTVQLLLDYNANPNEHCSKGKTPVHAAIISGDTKLLGMLIRYGGDLRLHDEEGRNAKDFILLMDNAETKKKLLKYLEEIRSFAMLQTSKSSQHQSPASLLTSPDERANAFSVGYGLLLKKAHDIGAPIIATHINEDELVHDESGITANNGAFMVYESMIWKDKIKVTVKRLHNQENRIDGAYVDLLIQEQNILGRISFPRIIQLVGISKTPNLESQSLVFESLRFGSVYNIVHENLKSFSLRSIIEIISHICDALIYLHEQRIIHCYVNSHSILLVDSHTPKLANFEYAVEKAADPKLQKKSRVVENVYTNCAYNWMAPEIMDGDFPAYANDMYGYCSVIWELFNKNIPWRDMEWSNIKERVLEHGEALPIDYNLIPLPLNRIVKDGLNCNIIQRMSFEEVKVELENYRLYERSSKKVKKQMSSGAVDLNNNNTTTNCIVNQNTNNNSTTNDNTKNQNKSRSNTDLNKFASFSEGIASINDVVNTQDVTNLSSMEEYDRFSHLSDSKDIIMCDNYKAEFHLTRGGPHSVRRTMSKNKIKIMRAASNNYEKSKRNSMVDPNSNRSQSRKSQQRSTDYHLDSIGLLSVNSTNLNRKTSDPSQFSATRPPPPPPPPPMNNLQQQHRLPKTPQKSCNQQIDSMKKPPLNKQYTKSTATGSLPLPPNYLTPTTPNSKGATCQGYTDRCSNNGPSTPKSLLKPAVSSQSLLDELRAKIEEQAGQKTEEMLKAWYLRIREQQKIISQEKERHDEEIKVQKKHLQQQHLEEQHNRQASEYQFESNEDVNSQQQQQQVSTPIHNSQLRPGYFDRENPFRKSDKLGENLQKPTPDDKMRYFHQKQDLRGSKQVQLPPWAGDRVEKRLDMEEISAIEENSDNSESGQVPKRGTITDKMKMLYSTVKKTTPKEENPFYKERIRTFERQSQESLQQNNQLQQQQPQVDNYNRLSQELRNRYLSQKDESAAQPFQQLSKPTNLPIFEQGHNSRQRLGFPPKQTTALPRRLQQEKQQQQQDNSVQNRYTSRLKSSSLGPSSSHDNEQFYSGFGSVKNLVESYEGIPFKEQVDAESKVNQIRMQRQKEITDAIIMTKQGYGIKKEFLNEHVYNEDEDFEEENDQDGQESDGNEEEDNHILSEQEQFEFSLRLVEEQERKANQFIQKASTQQSSQQQQQQQQAGPTHNQLQSKELSTISEKTEFSYTANNQFHAAASNTTTVTSPILTNEKTTNSKGTSVTKSIRNLDNNRFLDTSTGISDAFSVRNNPTPNSTPQQLMSPDSRFSDRNINNNNGYDMTSEENFYEAANNTTPTSRQRNMFNSSRQPTNTNQSKKQVASGRNHSANNMASNCDYQEVDGNKNNKNNNNNNSSETTETQTHHANPVVFRVSPRSRSQQTTAQQQQQSPRNSKNRVSSECQFTSQEDILSMSNNHELTMTELSDFSYLETFEKYKASKLKASQKRRSRSSRKENQDNNDLDVVDHEFPSLPEHLKKTLNSENGNTYEGLNSESTTMPQTPMTPMTPMTPNFSFKKQSFKKLHNVSMKTKCNDQSQYKELDEPSSCSAGGDVSSETSSFYGNDNRDSNNNNPSIVEDQLMRHKSGAKSTTCRRDTVYIDTSKYQGYQCKIETKSNTSNEYQIESRLTNEKTGHSFLLAKTRVHTPKLSTKVFIDR